jgi:hypothetical protein
VIGEPQADEMRAFMLVVRQGLLLIVCFIERKYGLTRQGDRAHTETN